MEVGSWKLTENEIRQETNRFEIKDCSKNAPNTYNLQPRTDNDIRRDKLEVNAK